LSSPVKGSSSSTSSSTSSSSNEQPRVQNVYVTRWPAGWVAHDDQQRLELRSGDLLTWQQQCD
jgi:hypothetical protein